MFPLGFGNITKNEGYRRASQGGDLEVGIERQLTFQSCTKYKLPNLKNKILKNNKTNYNIIIKACITHLFVKGTKLFT